MKKHHLNNKKGVTLLELMIAVFVLSVGTTAIFGLISNTIYSASIAKTRLAAAYLAQEGIELTRNIRDINYVQGKDNWKDGLIHCSEGCSIGYDKNELSLLGEYYLKIDSDNFYNSSSEPGLFKRTIFINEFGVGSGQYLEVKAEVEWDEKSEKNTIEVIEHLYDWR